MGTYMKSIGQILPKIEIDQYELPQRISEICFALPCDSNYANHTGEDRDASIWY